MPVVYIDVVWLVNLVMDAALLWTTCWLLGRRRRLLRIGGGALLGSLYALLVFVPPLALLTTWPGKALVSLMMVMLAVPWKNAWDLARVAATFYLVACVCAGAAIALQFAIPGVSVAGGVISPRGHLLVWTTVGTIALMVAIPTAAALVRSAVGSIRRQRQRQSLILRIRAHIAGHTVECAGLVDTGNQLRDPLSRRPVHLIDAGLAAMWFPPSARPLLEEGRWEELASAADAELARRLTFVPYRGAGGGSQLALAIRPDLVEVLTEDGWRAAPPCLLALHPGNLAHDGTFQAILHTEAVTGVDGDDREHRAETASSVAAAPETVVDAHSHPLGGRG